jgi:23S rRNA pseudouridine2605 synthase
MAPERLQKILAEAGIASRRAAERMIQEGRVTVNGSLVAEPGVKADAEIDEIRVDGEPIDAPALPVYLMLHKPRGYVTTARDERGRRSIMDLVYKTRERVFPVGRLDMDSEGLLLLTNDGELAQRLTHPSHEVEKEYLALVRGTPDQEALRGLRRGVTLNGRLTAPAVVEPVRKPEGLAEQPGHSYLRLVLREGRKRQVRLMCEAVGHPVERLIRVRIGPLRLRGLVPGRVRELTPAEIERIRSAAGLDQPRSGAQSEKHNPQQ